MDNYLEKKQKKHETSWKNSYRHLTRLINEREYKIGAELGVAFGGHSEYILKNSKIDKLFGIDRYKHDLKYKDGMNLPQEIHDKLYRQVENRLSSFGHRFELIRKSTYEAAKSLKIMLDFVYIDADHSFNGVKKDIITWYPKINMGGIISGHDYGSKTHTGVKKAVDEFVRTMDLELNICEDGVWWVEKIDEISFDKRIVLWIRYLRITIFSSIKRLV